MTEPAAAAAVEEPANAAAAAAEPAETAAAAAAATVAAAVAPELEAAEPSESAEVAAKDSDELIEAEKKRQRKMKQMSRALGVDITQVARMLEAQETGVPLPPPPEDRHETILAEISKQHMAIYTASKAVLSEGGAAAAAGSAAGAAASCAAAEGAHQDKAQEEPAPGGTVLVFGTVDYGAINPKDPMAGGVDVPHRLPMSLPVRRRVVAVFSGCAASHTVALDDAGVAYAWGKNDAGQLGNGAVGVGVAHPAPISGLHGKTVRSVGCGKSHTLLVTGPAASDWAGAWELWSFGAGKCGQLGNGRQAPSQPVPHRVNMAAEPRQVSAGAEFSVVLDRNGQLWSFGSPEYGQLGNGTDGKYFVTASKLTFDWVTHPTLVASFKTDPPGATGYGSQSSRDLVTVTPAEVTFQQISCGKNHVLALEGPAPGGGSSSSSVGAATAGGGGSNSSGATAAAAARVFSWGFGGYGRLGHNAQDDEMTPRSITMLGRLQGVMAMSSVVAGASCSLGLGRAGHLWWWGKLANSPRGEATMRPVQFADLYDWQIRCAAAGGQAVLVASDESTIGWGVGVNGELGLGESKRTSKPVKVEALEGLHVGCIAVGLQHTVVIARDSAPGDAAKLAKLAEWSSGSSGGAKGKGGGSSGGKGDGAAAAAAEEEEAPKGRKKATKRKR